MVIDIGGGTTEIAVIALSGIVCDTSIRTGGDELDQAIVQFMRKNYNLLVGEPTAEQIKIQIGSAAPLGRGGGDGSEGARPRLRHSQDGAGALDRDPRSDPGADQQIVDAVRRALEITPPELASDIVDRGIVMTGGGALIRGLDLLLIEETGLPVHVDEDPLTCVVRGTGRILDDFDQVRQRPDDLSFPGGRAAARAPPRTPAVPPEGEVSGVRLSVAPPHNSGPHRPLTGHCNPWPRCIESLQLERVTSAFRAGYPDCHGIVQRPGPFGMPIS